MTGHLLGAAGAIETIVMAMAIETGKVHLQLTVTILMKVWIWTMFVKAHVNFK